MESSEDSEVLKPQEETTEMGVDPFTIPCPILNPVTEQSLVQEFHNVGLNDKDEDKHMDSLEGFSDGRRYPLTSYAEDCPYYNAVSNDNDGDKHKEDSLEGVSDGRRYPLRPYAEDCPYYLRMGTCKFGLNCKFNHPVRRGGKDKEKEKEKEREGLSEKTAQIECKYYLTAGGCKFGKACRYSHSKENTEIAPPELNFLGLPIRPGEKECPFYMRTGSCGYGVNCRYHHPDPTAVEGSEPYNSTLNGESVGGLESSSGYHNGESVPLHLLGASQPAVVPSSLHMISDKMVPYFDNQSSYLSVMHSFPQMVQPNSEWNGNQAPIYPHERMGHPHSASAVSNLMKKGDVSINHRQEKQVEEFPERPGEPECAYFMKTGDCKYKSACRYHHPRGRASNLPTGNVNDKGLPLRPGKKICWHYEKNGDCKYGRACLFDHPVNCGSSAFPLGSLLEPPPGSNSATLVGMRMGGSGNGSEALTQQYL